MELLNVYLHENGERYLSARKLYSILNIKRDFPTWMNHKILACSLVEGKDYIKFKVPQVKLKPFTEYDISIKTALSMLSNTKNNSNALKVTEYLSKITGLVDESKTVIEKHKKTIEDKNKMIERRENVIIPNEKVSEEFGSIRMIEIDGVKYTVANDIAKALGYSNHREAVRRHCKAVVKRDIPTQGGIQSVNFITEGDVYRLVTHSKMDYAKKFESWVFDKVIPSVRDHGMYVTDSKIEDLLNNPDTMIEVLQRYKKEKAEKEALLLIQQENLPKVSAYEDFLCVSEIYSFADVTKMIKIPKTANSTSIIGRNTLMSWLRRDGILSDNGENKNIPYQKYINQGLFEVKPINDYDEKSRLVVRATPKGVAWIYNKYRYSNMNKNIDIMEAIEQLEFDDSDIAV